jgi:hypothetical protein
MCATLGRCRPSSINGCTNTPQVKISKTNN